MIYLITMDCGDKMYQSKKPTKEKKQFFDFMESNKKSGSVGKSKISKYVQKKGYTGDVYPRKGGGYWTDIKNKRGTIIAETLVRKKHVTWWEIK